jgi:BirA family biotin operon repressor/biotin-[acetyl-CoA-carboxylase] ligase
MRFANIIRADTLPSTNTALKDRLAAGEPLPDGTVLVARRQIAGRGRKPGRTWVAPADANLTASMLLILDADQRDQLGPLSLVAGLAIHRMLGRFDISARVKWPNDVLVDDAKIAGVLIEVVNLPANQIGVVIGIGVNVNMDVEDLAGIGRPATSILAQLGYEVPVEDVLTALLTELSALVDTLLASGWDALADSYAAVSVELAERSPVRVTLADGHVITGTPTTIDSTGALLLTTDANETIPITEGDVERM